MDYDAIYGDPLLTGLFKNECKALMSLKSDYVVGAKDIIT